MGPPWLLPVAILWLLGLGTCWIAWVAWLRWQMLRDRRRSRQDKQRLLGVFADDGMAEIAEATQAFQEQVARLRAKTNREYGGREEE